MGQSFFPPEQTEEKFHYPKKRASTALLQALMNVWRKLIRNPVFPVSNWSVFMFSVRTSIDLEGWYNRQVLPDRTSVSLHAPYRAVQGSNRYTCTFGCTTIVRGEEGKNQQEEDQLYLLNGKLFQMWSDYRDE